MFFIHIFPIGIHINAALLKITSIWQRTQRQQNISQAMLRSDNYLQVLRRKEIQSNV